MAVKAYVKYRAGLYKNLPAKRDADTLYFVTDKHLLYKGQDLYTQAYRVVTFLPNDPVEGLIYITADGCHIYEEGQWVSLTKPVTTRLDATSSHSEVPSAAAVYSAIAAATSGGISSTKAGTVTAITNQIESTIKLAGVVYSPSYDEETRTIHLPYNRVGSDGLVESVSLDINLGKDLMVASGRYDADAKNIVLVLNNDEEIVIPVGDLIAIHVGGRTETARTTVSSTGIVTVDVNVSEAAGNAIRVKADGLYVPDHSATINNIQNTVNVLAGDAETEGSLASIKKELITVTETVTTIEETAATWQEFIPPDEEPGI